MNGNHEGHQTTLEKSSVGSCDGGVTWAFKEEGFCSDHIDPAIDKF